MLARLTALTPQRGRQAARWVAINPRTHCLRHLDLSPATKGTAGHCDFSTLNAGLALTSRGILTEACHSEQGPLGAACAAGTFDSLHTHAELRVHRG
jgi:hypothetical protein